MQKQAQQTKEVISFEQAKKDIQKIVGLSVSRTWKGYGSAIFFELGELQKKYQKWINKDDGKNYHMIGDWTLWIESDWTIFNDNVKVTEDSIIDNKDIEKEIDQFDGAIITGFDFYPDGTAIEFFFNTNLTLKVKRENYGFFHLIYNHVPYLVFGEDGNIFYEHNAL